MKKNSWNTARKIARERDNNRCVKCGSEYKLHVHHLDETGCLNKELRNHILSNLITLCLPHHLEIHGRNGLLKHREKALELKKSGYSIRTIAKILDVTENTAYGFYRRLQA